jgi:SulP family sulfate permease
MSLSILTAGVVQIVFSIFRLGNLVKYVPYPVMAGFMNGIALLLIMKQVAPLLGVDPKIHKIHIVLNPGLIQPLTCLVGLFTLAVIFISDRWFKLLPGAFVGLLSGTILYHLIRFFFEPDRIGSTIGSIDLRFFPPPITQGLFSPASWISVAPFLPAVLVTGILTGLIGSMESLLSAVMADDITGSRHNNNRELLGQGVGNTISGFFGCLPGAGTIPETLDNYRAGGKTRLSSILTPILVLLIAGLFGKVIGLIPLAVFAAIVFAIGIEMVDSWSVNLVRQLPKAQRHRKNILANLGVALTVTVIMVSVNLIVAVGIGIIIASILFIAKMGKSAVRRKYLGSQIRSKKVRNREGSEILDRLGTKIVVFELHGPIFFGSGDNLAGEIHDAMGGARYCILDMKRVNEIDSSGAKSIVRASKALRKEGKTLLISYLREGGIIREFLSLMRFEKEFGEDRIFPDTDAALEMAENELLYSEGVDAQPKEMNLDEIDLLKDFTDDEIRILEKELKRREFCRADIAINTSEEDRDLYFLLSGSVSIRIPLKEGNHSKRLATYPAGTVFGEMAFLDGAPRSAEVVCDEDSVISVLPYEKFQVLTAQKPELALKLIRSIAVEVSRRLRSTSLEVAYLEEY